MHIVRNRNLFLSRLLIYLKDRMLPRIGCIIPLNGKIRIMSICFCTFQPKRVLLLLYLLFSRVFSASFKVLLARNNL